MAHRADDADAFRAAVGRLVLQRAAVEKEVSNARRCVQELRAAREEARRREEQERAARSGRALEQAMRVDKAERLRRAGLEMRAAIASALVVTPPATPRTPPRHEDLAGPAVGR